MRTFLGIAGFLTAMTLATAPAYAQGVWDPPGDDDACGDPMSPVLCNGATSAADMIGQEINRRYETG
ncbi:MAG: hypothetical protein ACI9MC_003955, partial [Kiritimatiellia bacterium]